MGSQKRTLRLIIVSHTVRSMLWDILWAGTSELDCIVLKSEYITDQLIYLHFPITGIVACSGQRVSV